MSEKKRRVLSAVLICLCIATVAFIWETRCSAASVEQCEQLRTWGARPDNQALRHSEQGRPVAQKACALHGVCHLGRGAAVPCRGEKKARPSGCVKLRLAALLAALTDETIQLISGRNSQVLDAARLFRSIDGHPHRVAHLPAYKKAQSFIENKNNAKKQTRTFRVCFFAYPWSFDCNLDDDLMHRLAAA